MEYYVTDKKNLKFYFYKYSEHRYISAVLLFSKEASYSACIVFILIFCLKGKNKDT